MDWGQHISETTTKSTKTLGFLLRNLAFAYKGSFKRHKLEYTAPILSKKEGKIRNRYYQVQHLTQDTT